MADLNLVVTTVCVSGKKVHFAHLKLQQAFNQHSWLGYNRPGYKRQ
jgi:hypothetical protein